MFIRTRERHNGKVTILIVDHIREKGKVKQKTLRNVATVPPEDEMRFRELAEHIKAEMEVLAAPNMFAAPTLAEMVIAGRQRSIGDVTPLPVNLRKLREEARIVTGIHDIYGSLYDEIGFGRVMNKCSKSRFILKDIVMARLALPCRKRSSALQGIAREHSRNLLTEEVNLLFYD
jgi:hypothetical protein